MFLCVQLGSQIRHFHSLNLRLLALSPHYMLSEVLFQTKMTVLRNSAIHVSTKTVPYFHTTFHHFRVDIDGQVTILVAVAGRKDPGNEAQLLHRMITGEAGLSNNEGLKEN